MIYLKRSHVVLLLAWLVTNGAAYSVILWHESRPSESCSKIPQAIRNAFANVSAAERPFAIQTRLMKPLKIEDGHRYPLVIFLHGSGGRGFDNCRQLRGVPSRIATNWREKSPCFCLVPQCPDDSWWSSHHDALEELIRSTIREHPIDSNRVYLAGNSMGGYGAWSLAAHCPELFAAVAPACGGGDPETVGPLKDIPVWAVHGALDKAVPVEEARQMVEALSAICGNVTYTELPDMGHGIGSWCFGEEDRVLTWLFRQKRSARSGVATPPRSSTESVSK